MKNKVNTLILEIVCLCAVLVVASLVSVSDGASPSSCENRADGKILSMKVRAERKSVDISSKHSSVIDVDIKKGYSVELTVLASSKDSSSGKGSIWLTTTAYGYSSGMCIDKVKISPSGQTTTHVSINGLLMGQAAPGLQQNVKWGSWPDTEQISYNVRWH
ncbi:MAG: hypothetical protein ABJB85_04445 [Nitrososphaerota archaeon]